MIMWIVLGSLVFIVVGFLVISSLWDKRKRKKNFQLLKQKKANAKKNISKVSIWIVSVINEIEKQVKKFIPSIGKYKMSDLNQIAKDEIKKIKKSDEFKSIIADKELHDAFVENINILIRTKPNMWFKKQKEIINFWTEQIKTNLISEEKKKELMEYKRDIIKKIKELYE